MVDAPALAASTLSMLEHGGLQLGADALRQRLLAQPLCDETGGLLPYVELVLFEIRHIARRLHYTKEDKLRAINQALTLAGF
jgi:hypothetical protein